SSDDRVRRRCGGGNWIFRDHAGSGDAPDLVAQQLGKPQIAVRSRGDVPWLAGVRRGRELDKRVRSARPAGPGLTRAAHRAARAGEPGARTSISGRGTAGAGIPRTDARIKTASVELADLGALLAVGACAGQRRARNANDP